MNIKNLSLPLLGFLQATGLLIYISLVSLFMLNANRIFGTDNNFFGPIAFLLLFVISASISGLLVLGRAGMFFWDKKYQQAFTLVGWTLGWAFFYLVLVFFALYLTGTPNSLT